MNDLNDRMKMLELVTTGERFLPLLPVCARIDGKCFHNFCKGLFRPYDKRLSDLMIAVTIYLVEETNACIGYTQSDEISLVWYSSSYKSKIFFDGRIQKMCSTLASMTTATFNSELFYFIPEKRNELALFDCRVWSVPTLFEAANYLLWRECDAVKNSISMAAQSVYSHKMLHKKNGKQKQEMLHTKGVNWDKYPTFFKRGTYVQRHKKIRKFTVDEIKKLPVQHFAHKNPDLMVERTSVKELEMPVFSTVANRVGVVFNGDIPRRKDDEELQGTISRDT